jgi:hypothetical protein
MEKNMHMLRTCRSNLGTQTRYPLTTDIHWPFQFGWLQTQLSSVSVGNMVGTFEEDNNREGVGGGMEESHDITYKKI